MIGIVIKSESLVKITGLLGAGKFGWHNAKAMAVFPFIIVRNKKYSTPVFINHEKIHFAQQVETLFFGVFIIKIIEAIYAIFVLRLNQKERYLWHASEQEAYINQEDLEYLKTRKTFTFFKYLCNKKKISFDKKRGSPYVNIIT